MVCWHSIGALTELDQIMTTDTKLGVKVDQVPKMPSDLSRFALVIGEKLGSVLSISYSWLGYEQYSVYTLQRTMSRGGGDICYGSYVSLVEQANLASIADPRHRMRSLIGHLGAVTPDTTLPTSSE